MPRLLLAILFLVLFSAPAHARPISYAGGWTVMQQNNHGVNRLHAHYSPSAWWSVGLANEFYRGDEFSIHMMQVNHLVKRRNTRDSQANLYLKGGIGIAENDSHTRPALWAGVAGDWETQRYFVSYENRFTQANDIDTSARHAARVGIAPYIGNYGDLHTWLMLQVEVEPNAKDNIVVTPLVRMFKGPLLTEFGVTNNGDAMVNWIMRF